MTQRQLFLNLAVNDLSVSIQFFSALGFRFDPNITDDHATCLVLNDSAFVMLLERSKFQGFTQKEVADSTTTTEAIVCVSASSREDVDDLVSKALAAGGKPANEPMDHGSMYGSSFQDPDGHLWEVVWMDNALPG